MLALTIALLIVGYSLMQVKKPSLQPIRIRREDDPARHR